MSKIIINLIREGTQQISIAPATEFLKDNNHEDGVSSDFM